MPIRPIFVLGAALGLAFVIVLPCLATSEIKPITVEADYIMGDGESPAFAESMAIQKAKRLALEEAGTYVESYASVKNYDLTIDEIQTIAGGILNVEVLGSTRKLVENGLRVNVKIRAYIKPDAMDTLVTRIKGRNIADQYRALQEQYAQLAREINSWKTLLLNASYGSERQAALDEIRQREREFGELQKQEAGLFEIAVSGEALIIDIRNQRGSIEKLINSVQQDGYSVSLGQPKAYELFDNSGMVRLRIPARLSLNKSFIDALIENTKRLKGHLQEIVVPLVGIIPQISGLRLDIKDVGKQYDPWEALLIDLTPQSEASKYFREQIGNFALGLRFLDKDGSEKFCSLPQESLSLLFPMDLLIWDDISYGSEPGYQRWIKRFPEKKKDFFLKWVSLSTYPPKNAEGVVGSRTFYAGDFLDCLAEMEESNSDKCKSYRVFKEVGSPSGNRWVIAFLNSTAFDLDALVPERFAGKITKIEARFYPSHGLQSQSDTSKRGRINCTLVPQKTSIP